MKGMQDKKEILKNVSIHLSGRQKLCRLDLSKTLSALCVHTLSAKIGGLPVSW